MLAAAGLPDMWAFESVKTTIGLIYLVICGLIAFSSMKGWLTVFSWAFCSLVIVAGITAICSTTPWEHGLFGYSYENLKTHQIVNMEEFIDKKHDMSPSEADEMLGLLGSDVTKSPKKVWNMHARGFIEPDFFHPASLVYCPFLALIAGVAGWFIWRKD